MSAIISVLSLRETAIKKSRSIQVSESHMLANL